FKQVNDSLGHDLGDRLLEEVAGRFGDIIRPADTLARFGGDEFALLLEGTHEAQAVAAAKRLLRRLSEPIGIAGHELALGASIGVATHAGGSARSDDLIRHADLAMYAAKEAGRGLHPDRTVAPGLGSARRLRHLGQSLGKATVCRRRQRPRAPGARAGGAPPALPRARGHRDDPRRSGALRRACPRPAPGPARSG